MSREQEAANADSGKSQMRATRIRFRDNNEIPASTLTISMRFVPCAETASRASEEQRGSRIVEGESRTMVPEPTKVL
jgi:hypothetical protein